ncbi:MAG: hypothetical protein K9M57_09605 [Phycisphaerae bacterium]|nr:hypothetical protein [Phycisphaerae bacterium]
MQERIDKKNLKGHACCKETDSFLDNLTAEERMLIVLQAELYDDSWAAMLTDLKNRLEGKPYIFKLANRIKDDIDRIEKLHTFEKKHTIKLSDYVKPPKMTD